MHMCMCMYAQHSEFTRRRVHPGRSLELEKLARSCYRTLSRVIAIIASFLRVVASCRESCRASCRELSRESCLSRVITSYLELSRVVASCRELSRHDNTSHDLEFLSTTLAQAGSEVVCGENERKSVQRELGRGGVGGRRGGRGAGAGGGGAAAGIDRALRRHRHRPSRGARGGSERTRLRRTIYREIGSSYSQDVDSGRRTPAHLRSFHTFARLIHHFARLGLD